MLISVVGTLSTQLTAAQAERDSALAELRSMKDDLGPTGQVMGAFPYPLGTATVQTSGTSSAAGAARFCRACNMCTMRNNKAKLWAPISMNYDRTPNCRLPWWLTEWRAAILGLPD